MKNSIFIFSLLYSSIAFCAQPQAQPQPKYTLSVFYDSPREPAMKYYLDGKKALVTHLMQNKKKYPISLYLEFSPNRDNPQNSVSHMLHYYATSGDGYNDSSELENITYKALKKVLHKKPQEVVNLQEIAGLVGQTFNFNKGDLPKDPNPCCTLQ
ncbi:MAG: hypothetical protein P4L31_01540 [Candidatus Babeliales bacterium]|nr:hypothetical protein [Candidatus Babeliales bacterium]